MSRSGGLKSCGSFGKPYTEMKADTFYINMKTASCRNTENERERRAECLHASNIESNHMVVPQWVKIMYNTVFFKVCIAHPDAKKNNLDHFCIDCRQPICSNCLSQHINHNHVKIRRYIYSDVINRHDLCKLFNCSGIQTYHTNKAKVIFLKQRRGSQQQSSNKLREYMCTICHKNLQDKSLYCSVACKVIAIHANESQIKTICYGFEADNRNVEASFARRPKFRRKGVPQRSPLF